MALFKFKKKIRRAKKRIDNKLYEEYYFGSSEFDYKEALKEIKKKGLRYRTERNAWGNITLWIRQ